MNELIKTDPPEARAALALNSTQTEIDLRALAIKNVSIVQVIDKAGREQAHGAAMEIKRARVAIEKTGKDARDDATKFSKAVIAEEKRLIAIIEGEETRLIGLRDAWDEEQARIKAEEEAKEKARIAAIHARIAEIRNFATQAALCRAASSISELLDKLQKIDLGGFDEFAEESSAVHAATVSGIQFLLTEKQKDEAEQARIKAKQEAAQAALLKAKAEQEAERLRIKAEHDAAAAELKQAKDKVRAEQAAAAAKLAAERAAMEEDRARMKAQQESEQAALKREQAKVKAEQDAAAAKLEAERAELAAAKAASLQAIEDAKQQDTPPEPAKTEPQVSAPVIAANPADSLPPSTQEHASVARPTDMEIFGVIVAALADHYLVPVSTVIGWLDDMDIDSVARTFRSD